MVNMMSDVCYLILGNLLKQSDEVKYYIYIFAICEYCVN
jgi:hypothetical protein